MSKFLELFRPDVFVASIVDIDLRELKSSGCRALMLDLDNTILPWKNSDVPESSRQWVEAAKSLGMKLCIVSNTHNPKRLSRVAEDLGIPSLYRALKPRRYGFQKAAAMLDCNADSSIVVGDQLLTDILGGNLAGFRTILVQPMHPREFFGTKISRLVERGILALLRRKSQTGTNADSIQSERQESK